MFIGEKFRLWNNAKEICTNYKMDQFKIDCNKSMSFVDIGVLRVDGAEVRSIKFYPKNETSETIPVWSAKREPLSYPLLFSRGELGWGRDNTIFHNNKKINTIEYLAAMLLYTENIYLRSKMYNYIKINVNRFQALPRTGQTFVVDGISTMIDTHLKFPKDHPELITGGEKKYHKKKENGKLMIVMLLFYDII